MAIFPVNVDWIADLIPGMSTKIGPFVVDTEEVDDELVAVFIEEIKRLAGDLQDGLFRNDPDAVRMAAHSIKGMGGTVGLPEISVLGLEIENMAKANRLPDARPLVDGLVRWMAGLS